MEALLENKALNQKSNLVDTLHEVSESIPKRSMVILFTDLFDNSSHDIERLYDSFQHLRFNKHEVVLFNVLQHDLEMDLNYEDRPYSFVDPETSELVKLNPKYGAKL